MTTTNFVNGITLTDDDWFNDVDALTYEGTFPSGPSAVVVTGATTLAVFNTVATTINAFGAASVALNIGNASAAAAFPGGITIPTGKTLSGAGTINITGGSIVITSTGATASSSTQYITSGGNSSYIGREGSTPAFGALANEMFLYNGGLGLKMTYGATPSVSIPNALTVGNNVDLTETTAPSGLANTARLFSVDNGSGKTVLKVIFGSGSAVQLAIEP